MPVAWTVLGVVDGDEYDVEVDGFWHGNNLPARSLEVVAWKMSARALGQNSRFDTLAATVPFPWEATVTIEAFD